MEQRPAIDYLSKDFASFRQVMLDRLSATLPLWKERHLPDLGITFADLLAYVADHLSYYQDAVATEAYLGTARQRISVRRHAKLLDYVLHEGCNARTWVHIEVEDTVYLKPNEVAFVALAGRPATAAMVFTQAELGVLPSTTYEIFEPVSRKTITLPLAHNCMPVAGQLAAGETRAVIQTGGVAPEKGSVLILRSRPAADASGERPQLTHPVAVVQTFRHDDEQHTVVWHEDDALPNHLAEQHLDALGNNVLVDHGQTICEQASVTQDRLGPLSRPWPSHSLPVRRQDLVKSASRMLLQEPRDTLPNIMLGDGHDWAIRPDLLQSLPSQRHFCAEIDDSGHAHIRFGDGMCGMKPEEGSTFTVRYRVGNGATGNVAAGAIGSLTGCNPPPEIKSVYNPLSAAGGTERESAATARLVAPGRMRMHQHRAISPDDYANFAREIAGVQQAAVVIVQEGARRVVRVALDPKGFLARAANAPHWGKWQVLARRVAERLELVRRINHVVVVVPPTYVDLRLELGLEVFSSYVWADVERQVRRALFGLGEPPTNEEKAEKAMNDAVNELPESGVKPMFHPDNLTFGQSVHWSRIVAAIHKVPGVARIDQIQFGRTDRVIAIKANPTVTQISIEPHEIAVLVHDEDHFTIRPIETPAATES